MAYGLKYTLTFNDLHRTDAALWEVGFYFQDYTGDTTELTGSDDPLVITRGEDGQDKMVPVVGSQVEIGISVTDSKFDITQFFVIQQFEIKIVIKKDGVVWWDGFVKPDYCEYDYAPVPFHFKVLATDGIALLKNTLVDLTEVKRDTGYVSILNLLMERGLFLTQHGNNALRVMSSLRRTGETKTLAGLSTRYELWVDDKDAYMNVYDILTQIAKSFTSRVFFDQGYVYFQRIADLVNPNPTIWQYTDFDEDPAQITLTENFFKILKGELSSSEMIYEDNDAHITIMSPYKQSLIDVDYKFRTWLLNGDWHDWDGSTFANWNTLGATPTYTRHGTGTKDDPYSLFFQRNDGDDSFIWQSFSGVPNGSKFSLKTRITFYNTSRAGFRFYITKTPGTGETGTDNDLKLFAYRNGTWVLVENGGSNDNNFIERPKNSAETGVNYTDVTIDMDYFNATAQVDFDHGDTFSFLLMILDPGGTSGQDESDLHGVEIGEIKISLIENFYTGETYTNRTGKDYSKYNTVDNFSILSSVTESIANKLHYSGDGSVYWTSDDVPVAIENFQALSLYSTMNINSFPFEVMTGTFYSNKVKFFNTIQRAFGQFKLFMQLYDEYHVKECKHRMTLAEIREVVGIQDGSSSIRKFKIQ